MDSSSLEVAAVIRTVSRADIPEAVLLFYYRDRII